MFDISNIMTDSSNLIWMKFDIKPLYWNMAFDFVCGFVYMSPEGSSTHSEKIYVLCHKTRWRT